MAPEKFASTGRFTSSRSCSDIIGVGILDRFLEFCECRTGNTEEFGDDLRATLMNGLRRALRLDGEDKRVFVIRRDFASIVQAQGERADIYLATPPSNCAFNGRTIADGSSVYAYSELDRAGVRGLRLSRGAAFSSARDRM